MTQEGKEKPQVSQGLDVVPISKSKKGTERLGINISKLDTLCLEFWSSASMRPQYRCNMDNIYKSWLFLTVTLARSCLVVVSQAFRAFKHYPTHQEIYASRNIHRPRQGVRSPETREGKYNMKYQLPVAPVGRILNLRWALHPLSVRIVIPQDCGKRKTRYGKSTSRTRADSIVTQLP